MRKTYRQAGKAEHRGKRRFLGIIVTIAVLCAVLLMVFHVLRSSREKSPEELLITYMDCIPDQKYEEMYEMIDAEASGNITLEDFTERNSAIYEGIEMQNMEVQVTEYNEKEGTVRYQTSFDTAAGKVSFEKQALFKKGQDGYKLVWGDSMIFPELGADDRVRVSTTRAERGEILDCNGTVLAGKGVVSSVGIVPGRLVDRDNAVRQIADLLEVDAADIEEELSAGWVREDSFVPLKSVPKINEMDLMTLDPDEEILKEHERQEQLLKIPGVMISDKEVREYPLGEAAAHLVGYVQSVTAEDLENHAGEGYSSDSVIGKTGMEALFETELKGKDGCRIYITDSEGREKTVIAETPKEDGDDIRLTIDSRLQKMLYEQFREDRGCSVAMNPYTGEVLALVSTPSYDNNDFILGLSEEQWTALNESEDRPLYNRFRQIWCPGSSFKPVVASIGLETGAIDPAEDFGEEGLSWQKDASWGSYRVTTLHEYAPVILKNALICSDNIYFAKAALKIGADNLTGALDELGFNQELPFEITMAKSQYSNSGQIETEIQLADSGYGQGEILVNPLHLAAIYTSFLNDGNIIRPYLEYRDDPAGEVWIEQAFSPENAAIVLEGLTGVVNDSHGTGYKARREDILLAGKTGTAEIKASQSATSGTEIGWFTVFTAEKNVENPILLVSMVENVKEIGGSGYVVEKDKAVLDAFLP